MKTIPLALLLFCIATGTKAQPAADSTGYLYVYRDGQFGGAMTNFTIYIDGEKTCKLSNGKYFRVPLPPGKHEIEARKSGMDLNKKETFISLVTEAGKNYYVSCDYKRSITRARLEMEEVTENTGLKEIKKMKEDNCQEKD